MFDAIFYYFSLSQMITLFSTLTAVSIFCCAFIAFVIGKGAIQRDREFLLWGLYLAKKYPRRFTIVPFTFAFLFTLSFVSGKYTFYMMCSRDFAINVLETKNNYSQLNMDQKYNPEAKFDIRRLVNPHIETKYAFDYVALHRFGLNMQKTDLTWGDVIPVAVEIRNL